MFFYVANSHAVRVGRRRRERYVDAQSLIHGSRAMSFVAGQSLGGVLVAVLTAPVAVLVDAFSFLGSAWFLARIRPGRAADGRARRGPDPRRCAVRARRSPIMRAALGATATVNLFTFAFSAVFILYVTRELGVSPALLGLVLGAGAIGGLLGAAVTARVARRIGVGPAVRARLRAVPRAACSSCRWRRARSRRCSWRCSPPSSAPASA